MLYLWQVLFTFQREQFAILWLLFALIVVGNSAVIVALQCGHKKKSRMNFFIMQLALAGNCSHSYNSNVYFIN